MAALILLDDYRMKKARKHPLSESQIPVDLATMREFRGELVGRMMSHGKKFLEFDKRFDEIDLKFEAVYKRFDEIDLKFEAVDKRFDQMDARFDRLEQKMDSMFHQLMLKMEEQNLRNKQAYDGYLITYEKVADFERRLKPECFKD